jgi:hypothetical protein
MSGTGQVLATSCWRGPPLAAKEQQSTGVLCYAAGVTWRLLWLWSDDIIQMWLVHNCNKP